MSDSSENKEQSDREKNVNDEYLEQISLANGSKTDPLIKDEIPSLALNTTLNETKDQDEDNKIEIVEESTSIEEKKVNSTENVAKRSKSTDRAESSTLCKSDIDWDHDTNKRQKLNECQPNTSTSDSNIRESSNEQKSNFRKLESKFKKRNYRNQSNSSDIDDLNDNTRSNPSIREKSSSSESIQQDTKDSSDERSEITEDNAESNEWTTASDDTDEMPGILQKKPTKSDWSILKDVINRQIGSNNSIPLRFYSSLLAVQRLELMYKLEEHNGCVNAIGFNQKGNLLASASDDLTITIWDWAIGKKHIALQTGHRSNVFQSKWLPLDMEYFVVSCARDGQVRLIDIRTSVSRKLAKHRAACHKISTHLDLPHLVLSAGEDSKILSIDIRESKPSILQSVKDNDQEVELYSIHSNPLNNFEFCVAGRTRFVKIYDRRKPTIPLQQLCPKHLLSEDQAHVTCAIYNHNGTEIVASYNNEDIYLFDTAIPYQSGDFAHKYQGHRNSVTVKGVNFYGPNSEFVISGSDCGNIFIWDKKTEAIVQWMLGDRQGIVNALEPHPHIPILATSGLDSDVKIWVPTREEPPNIEQQLQSCVKQNLTPRTKNIEDAENAFDGHFLWIMLRHIRQADRHRQLLVRIDNRNQNHDFDDDSDIDIGNDEDVGDFNENNDDDDDDYDDDDDDDDDDDSSSNSNDNSSESDDHFEN